MGGAQRGTFLPNPSHNVNIERPTTFLSILLIIIMALTYDEGSEDTKLNVSYPRSEF